MPADRRSCLDERAVRTIKKYPNRRLYDTANSGYITLADVKQMVLENIEFQVVDAKTGDDLTRAILLQIILDEEGGGVPMFSSEMLAQMIRFYGSAQQTIMGQYMEQNVKAFLAIQKKLQDQAKQVYGDKMMLTPDLWKQFMQMQAPAMQGMLGNYLEQSAKLFMDMQQRMQDQTRGMFTTFPFPNFSAPPRARRRRQEALIAKQLQHRAFLRCTLLHRVKRYVQRRRSAPQTPSSPPTQAPATPRVGFVSLGCPKALVDSEQILTQLRAEGYAIAPDYGGADLVVVNTCGFIDAAVAESLDAIGEALAENGKVIVTGCLGAKEGGAFVRDAHPKVLAVTGPHATHEVMSAVHAHLPKPHDPFTDLVPPQGIKLTPSHYAYLKISEGCNHRCTFCIIPAMRGDLVSRPLGEVMQEAENLVKAGVKELLVVSQDTSAYGVDVRYRTGFWRGRPVKTRMTELATALGELGVWVRLHYVYPYPHVDDVIPLMARRQDPAVPRRALPAREPADPEAHEAAGQRREHARAHQGVACDLSRHHHPLDVHRRLSRRNRRRLRSSSSTSSRKRSSTASAASPIRRSTGRRPTHLPDPVPEEVREERRARFMASAGAHQRRAARAQGRHDDARAGRRGRRRRDAFARSAADAPEIDGVVRVTARPGCASASSRR